MNSSKFILVMSLATALGLSACNVKNPNDVNKDLQKKLDEDNTTNNNMIELLKKSMELGGQPGSIKVSGVIVKDDATTDVRITLASLGGTGKDGTRVKVTDTQKPVLMLKNEKLDLSKIGKEKNLISLGCDEKTVSSFAKERSLEVQKVPAPISDGVLVISAKTIVLCGNMNNVRAPSLTGQFISFNADELVMDQVDYKMIGMVGSLSFNTNKLLLQGSNQIATMGISSSMTPSLELNVLKEISSNDDGKVLLNSFGSDYK